jgi:hypothetical protein
MANPSLDDILKEIERDSITDASAMSSVMGEEAKSAGMAEVAVHEQRPSISSPSIMAEDFRADNIPQITRQFLGGGAVMNEKVSVPGVPTGLSPRQKALPKLSYRMLGSLAAMLVLVVGLSSAVMLSQKPQDIRQYAFDPNTRVDSSLEPYRNKQAEQPTEPVNEPTSGDQPVQEPSVTGDQTAPQAQPAQLETVLAPQNQVWWQDPLVVAGGAVILSGILILAVFLHWLFAV